MLKKASRTRIEAGVWQQCGDGDERKGKKRRERGVSEGLPCHRRGKVTVSPKQNGCNVTSCSRLEQSLHRDHRMEGDHLGY